MTRPKLNVTYSAPVGSVDLHAEGWEIWPCPNCLPWHVEIVRHPDTDEVIAREWHAVDCPTFTDLLAETED